MRTLLNVFIAGLVLLNVSCSNKVPMKKSTIVPAAEATVKVKEADNGNYSISVNVINLAGPDRLTPARKHYVVWVKSSSGTFNVGLLNMSEELTGTLETETTYEPKRILISAEDDKEVVKISKQIVLESKKI